MACLQLWMFVLQLEEAEKRQEIMVNIVRKELEHEHRLVSVVLCNDCS